MKRRKISPETRNKIRLFAVYIAAIVFCIFWLAAEVDITRRVKQDRLTSCELLAAGERHVSDFASGLDPDGAEKAGERLLEFYSLAKRNSEAKSVLILLRRGYPRLSANELGDIGGVAAAMLQSPEPCEKYADDLIKAFRLISEDIQAKAKRVSPEAAEVFKKIRDEMSKAAY